MAHPIGWRSLLSGVSGKRAAVARLSRRRRIARAHAASSPLVGASRAVRRIDEFLIGVPDPSQDGPASPAARGQSLPHPRRSRPGGQ
ncbi:hypothetical protein [Williamsia sp. DF01-3]|uniref:hypothetical protein n=1 Tax=Williamsia sp. DF01-3 TaxID=2934157 RepID=UPI001FF69F8D|nr:hypothetical protein [Williamsia sp. DF01-3]MCK0517534.1 hypothetical protein [Williamsia sp. DF01-3]